MNMLNPWENHSDRQRFVTTSGGEPVEDNFKFHGQSQPAISSNGEINASDRRDVLNQIDRLMQASSVGAIKKQATSQNVDQNRAMLAAAFSDPSGRQWAMLGANMAEGIYMQAKREGFMRRILKGNTIESGVPRFTVSENTSVAIVATSASEVEKQFVRGKYFTPDEFHMVANLMVDDRDIHQVSGDILEDTYNDGVEAIMTGEDRIWKKAADATKNIENPITYIGSPLSPSLLAQISAGVSDWNIPAVTMILANDLWKDIIGNSDFHTLFSSIHRHDLVLNGQIGSLLGMNVITDAFRSPTQKVLERGEIYALGSPEHHGAYTDRGGVIPTPIDGAHRGLTAKGWFLQELLSMAVVNPRSVSIGIRM